MSDDLAFLHTSAVHIPRFQRLMHEFAPELRVRHEVAEHLLAEARCRGSVGAELRARVWQAMHAAATTGAGVVVCTCSTIGGAAVEVDTAGRFVAMRIDEAMMARAVELGPRVLVVAALADTMQPTTALLEQVAERLGVDVSITPLLVDDAWPAFMAGDMHGYCTLLANAIRQHAARIDVVLMAQASMAPAADLLTDLDVDVLSSPVLGVKAAIAAVASCSAVESSQRRGCGDE